MAVTNLQLGSLVLNTELLVALAAGIMGLLAVKLRLRNRAERDASPAWNAVGIWIAVWKGSLLLTDAAGVMRQPLSLLYYDGGTVGFWLACAATAGYLRFRYGRLYGRTEGWGATGSFAAGWSVVYLLAKIAMDTVSVQYGHWFGLFAALAMGLGLAGLRGIGTQSELAVSEQGEGIAARSELGASAEGEGSVRSGPETIDAGERRRRLTRRSLQAAGVIRERFLGAISYEDMRGRIERVRDRYPTAKATEGNRR